MNRRAFIGAGGLALASLGTGAYGAASGRASPSRDRLSLFPAFAPLSIETPRVRFRGVIGGKGPPLLLLHGYPETCATWHRIAPVLARSYTVVVPDIPGYGDSAIIPAVDSWSKRDGGAELFAMMTALGHARFTVVGHDRGGRIGYRMALDDPARVHAYVSLTVVPSLDMWETLDEPEAMSLYHWLMLAQPKGLPERLLAGDPIGFLNDGLLGMTEGDLGKLNPIALADYRRAFGRSSVRHAICMDYRAAVTADVDQEREDRRIGRRITQPMLVLWPAQEFDPAKRDPMKIWDRWADRVKGQALPGGHLQPELVTGPVMDNLLPFLRSVHA